MTRFQLIVLDESHIVLTTEEKMPPDHVRAASEAFELWKQRGGALIIGDCLMTDGRMMEIDLDLSRADNDVTPGAAGNPGDQPPSPRGLILGRDASRFLGGRKS